MSRPFVLWTMQRTGATALADFLMGSSERPSVEHEPFNWSYERPRQFWSIVESWIASRDEAALKEDLQRMASQGGLIKHCYELFNMRFNEALLEATAGAGYRHILLQRNDEGGRLISKFIAEAQGTWFTQYGREVYAEVERGDRRLRPIPVDLIVAQRHHGQNSTEALRLAMAKRNILTLEGTYEDLYLADPAKRSQAINRLLDGLEFQTDDREAMIAAFFEQTKGRGQRSFEVTGSVPNIESVIEGLAAAGCAPPAAFLRQSRLNELSAQLSKHASLLGWILTNNLGGDWPGFSFKFDQASSLEFRVESADMSFSNVYFGVKNVAPIHNKSLGEALAMSLGNADYSESWPWCRHPSPEDRLLPVAANWSYEQILERGAPDGSLAQSVVAAAAAVREVLAEHGYIAIGKAEWTQLHGATGGDSPESARPSRASLFDPGYLASLGFNARAIIDVGVWKGTSQLYAAFPDLPFVLVEPQHGALDLMESQPERFEFVNKGLGSTPAQVTLRSSGAKSSILERTDLTFDGPTASYQIELTTLDKLIDDLRAPGPFGVKLDTEGYEAEIIHGLDRHVADVEFIICEVSIRQRFKEGYQFSDLIALMRDKGFLFYNLLSEQQRRPVFYDVLFLRTGHPLFE